jgi:hypothetical protein
VQTAVAAPRALYTPHSLALRTQATRPPADLYDASRATTITVQGWMLCDKTAMSPGGPWAAAGLKTALDRLPATWSAEAPSSRMLLDG